jgi:hypothetical protein
MSGAAVPEGVHAVFTVDPGGTTGVFAGWVELKSTRRETLTDGLLKSKSTEVTGDYIKQARTLLALLYRFNFACNEANLPLQRRHVVVEDFQARPDQFTHHLTSCWVGGAFAMAYEMSGLGKAADITWQQPSDAKRLATNERLRSWGLWQVGSDHKRDAARHFVLKVDKLVG